MITVIEEDLNAKGITEIDVYDRNAFRQKVLDWNVQNNFNRIGAAWTDKRKMAYFERKSRGLDTKKRHLLLYIAWPNKGCTLDS